MALAILRLFRESPRGCLGLVFMGFGLVLLNIAKRVSREDGIVGSLFVAVIALSSFLVGIKIFRNGFPKR